ncbi:hypothetical protein [Chitinophaga rhizophila]|uniref:Uncharacterized protein n=1 Tax=Chitinophaga rhizophila TaxID=2866212 RepID=A0ABS7GAH6_9BACT|nr:hypothetical protein [Chitinophaga rhizophila]MBW8684667.1 hypothetical protein [Chitinophaga rhizophila]
MTYETKIVMKDAVRNAATVVNSSPLKQHPAIHPFQFNSLPGNSRRAPVVQRVEIKTGVGKDPAGTNNHNVTEMEVVNALYKKFLAFSKHDYPSPIHIDHKSNAARTNWDDEHALGEPRNLGDKPLNALWQIVMDYKKSRTLGLINITSEKNEGLSTARYNQYGPTSYSTGGRDTMVYKYPLKEEAVEDEKAAKTASDKGVSYKLAITKFKEIRTATKLTDAEIAAGILSFYKDGVVPKIIQDKQQARNFGYLVTLMTVPESVRSVGTFAFGLIMLDNISKGKATSEETFEAPAGVMTQIEGREQIRSDNAKIKAAKGRVEKEKKKEKSKQKISEKDAKLAKKAIAAVAPKYKDAIDRGGLYAPAFTGSKPPLNQMEDKAEAGDLSLHGDNVKETEPVYYWNTTLKRYNTMVKVFMNGHPELLSFKKRIKSKERVIRKLTDRIIDHFGIGTEITAPTTTRREIGREASKVLHNMNMEIQPEKFQKPDLIPSAGALGVSAFTFAAARQGEEEEEFTEDLFERQGRTHTSFSSSFASHELRPSSPTRGFGEVLDDVGSFVTSNRALRRDDTTGTFSGIPDEMEYLSHDLSLSRTSREINTSLLVEQKAKADEERRMAKKRKAVVLNPTGQKGRTDNSSGSEHRRKFSTPQMRKMQFIGDIQKVVTDILVTIQEQYSKKEMLAMIKGHEPFMEFVRGRLATETDLKMSDAEVENIISNQLNLFGFR